MVDRHSEMFLAILPVILHDALAEVRAQSRKCFWAFHRVFPVRTVFSVLFIHERMLTPSLRLRLQSEADNLFNRLDASTQKNLRDDAARTSEAERSNVNSNEPNPGSFDAGGRIMSRKVKTSKLSSHEASLVSTSKETAQNVASVQRVLQHSVSDVSSGTKQASSVTGPRRVLGASSGSFSASDSYGDGSESGRFPSRVLSQGALRVGFDARPKSSTYSEEVAQSGSDWKKQHTPVRPLRVLSTSETTSTSRTAADSLFLTRQEQSGAGFRANSQTSPLSGKPKRVQISADTNTSSQTGQFEQENGLGEGSRRIAGQSSSSLTSNVEGRSESPANIPASKPAAPQSGKQVARQNPIVSVSSSEKLEEAISSLESSSWSVRMDAVEYVGRFLQKQRDTKVDDRILLAFIKHMGDAHYRVSQAVLKHFLPLLQLTTPQQLQPHLKAILPKLFQKQVDTKESIRVIAKENLAYLVRAIDSSALMVSVIPILMDGGNMKVKAAVCHYLRELLPGADAYMKQGANNSHMRSFLSKLAQLLESEMPVSVTTACGELIQATAKLYGGEVEAAIPLLPPTKRSSLSKLLKARGIVLSLNAAQSAIASAAPPPPSGLLSSSSSSRTSGREQQEGDNQALEPVPERSSRKRSESPNANSSSPQRTIQKRKSATESVKGYSKATASAIDADKGTGASTSSNNGDMLQTGLFGSASAPKQAIRFEDLLDTLAQNNATERERRTALHKVCARPTPMQWLGYFDVYDLFFLHRSLVL